MTAQPVTAPGGTEKFTGLLREQLKSAGHEVEIFDSSRFESTRYQGLFEFGRLGEYRLAYDLARAFSDSADKFDALICNGAIGSFCRFQPKISIVHGHIADVAIASRSSTSWLVYLKNRYLDSWLLGRALANSTVVAVSGETGVFCKAFNHIERFTVIENAVDLSVFSPRDNQAEAREKLGLPQDRFLGLFVGRAEYRKGFDIIATMIDRLPEENRLVVVTPDRPPANQRMLTLTDPDYAMLPLIYNACDYFVFPTRSEGCSIALLEAYASGLPVIATRVGNGLDISASDRLLAEFLLDYPDVDRILGRIQYLFDNPETRVRMGEVGRQRVEARNSLQNFTDSYLQLISSVVQQSEAP